MNILMKKNLIKKLCLGATCTVLVTGVWTSMASAVPPFYQQFKAKYVDGDANKEFVAANKEFAEAVTNRKIRCFVCHDPKIVEETGESSKKNRNRYGRQLAKLLNKDTDKKNAEKIQKALETVAAMKSDSEDSDSPTFGDLIKAGKLPGVEEE